MDFILSILTTIMLFIAVLVMLVREYNANFRNKKNVIYLVGVAVCLGISIAGTISNFVRIFWLA